MDSKVLLNLYEQLRNWLDYYSGQTGNYVVENRYTAPQTNYGYTTTTNQYDVNRTVDRAITGIATGNVQQGTTIHETQYVAPAAHENVQVQRTLPIVGGV